MTSLLERQRAHFNSIAGRYRAARQDENHVELKRLMWSEFLRNKDYLNRPGLTVLDAMCGYADALPILREHLSPDLDYSGFDYSDEIVASVRRENPDVRIAHADVTSFSDGRAYDLVVLLGGLHHVHHAAPEAVRRLAAVVKPGGWLLNLEPTHGNALFGAIRRSIYRRNALFDAGTERGFSVSELTALFTGVGLEPVDIMYPGLLSYVLHYNPDAFPALNRGDTRAVRFLFALERPLMRSRLARVLSFATLSLWRRPA
jgi:SAM-dependent methyltransferase